VEPRTLRRLAAAGVIALAVGAGAAWWWRGRGTVIQTADGSEVRRLAPEGTRITVEVLNATTVRGLARRATFHLRDLGFDVVRFAGDTSSRDSTLVLDRSGHPEWAALVSRAFGGVPVEERPDSSRYVDVTVLVGSSWRPPAKPFHP
jgi:LytR cell envelope-related transcriptional attenuator